MYGPAWKASIIMAALTALAGLLMFECDANAADYAIVSFNDAEHLAALQDSVVDICDTTVMTIVRMEEGHSAVADSFRFVLDTLGSTITCRRLVDVEVTLKQELSIATWGQTLTPGEAIIFYEPYKEEQ